MRSKIYINNLKSSEEPRLAAWNLESNTFALLEDDLTETVLSNHAEKFIATDNTPYIREVMFGRGFMDLYLADPQGNKKLVSEKVSH